MGFKFPPGSRPPWMNERGQLLPENLPLDSTLARALSRDKRECREAVRLFRTTLVSSVSSLFHRK